ncbi:uncharacterized protein [Littorina saxatilis]|uniref:SWIM-type domain-containing protein n=1 Tax=Littorina saxatilis TaxID=31220 RepID=A0AAN9FYR1_9CAEN
MDLSDISLQKLRLWSVDALKYFLSVRKLSVDGDFDELVARSWAAFESDTPVDDEAEQRERRLLGEYKSKLTVDGETYPDPATFDDGWLSEETGRFSWPSLYISDISDYLKKTAANQIDLIHRLLNNYKEGKAYRYFTCEWVREIMYHPVRKTASLCILKAAVYPSMSIRNKPYRVWVMITKKNETSAGGEIKTAHCTCAAGMLGSCNHIAGLLFRVEAAVKCGATDLRGTENLCTWVAPSGSVARKPGKWRDNHVAKDVYGQKTSRERKEEARRLRKDFQPFYAEDREKLLDSGAMAQKLENFFEKEAADSVFILTRKKQKPAQPQNPILPATVLSLADSCSTTEELLEAMTLTEEEISAVERATRAQSDCAEWKSQRQGRITSSIFYNIHTKSETLKKANTNGKDKSTWLMDKIMGRGSTPLTVAMKHGLSLEPAAKQSYIQQTSKKHKKWSACDSGIVIDANYPFLASSPDLVTSCDCCGEGLCEIKCPESIKHEKPTVGNIPYLEEVVDGQIRLKKAHQYYGQIQGQMALTRRPACDLFVYSEHGSLIVPILFDEEFWLRMLANLEWFWGNQVAAELLRKTPVQNAPATASASCSHSPKRPSSPPLLLPDIPPPKRKRLVMQKSKVAKKVAVIKIYRCGVCMSDIAEEPASFCDFSIKCDSCPEWFHQHCVGFVEGSEPGDDDCWICMKCVV